MFGVGDKKLEQETTPERVYMVCQYLLSVKHGLTYDDFYNAMCLPNVFEDSTGIFKAVITAARDLELITLRDNQYMVTENLQKITDISTFRRYCARKIFQREDSLFFKVTSCICAHATELMSFSEWNQISVFLNKNNLKVDENSVLGWRHWFNFLGLGYLNARNVMCNWSRRIADVLMEQSEFEDNEEVPIDRFVNWLKLNCPETKGDFSEASIGMAVSNGLRTLDELGIIKILSKKDAAHWELAKIGLADRLSHIRIGG